MGFQRRFDKAYHTAKELIDSGTLGRIEAIRDTMRDPSTASRAYLAVEDARSSDDCAET